MDYAALQRLNKESVLSPAMTTIWDNLSQGVVVVDADGICLYMNKLQRSIDGFDKISVTGEHIGNLYLAHEQDLIPTLEVLRTGKPFLKMVYWYKTTHNQLINSVNDFFPLFHHGKVDGVISFTTTLGTPNVTQGQKKHSSRTVMPIKMYTFEDILGGDATLQRAVSDAQKAAQSSVPVMIWGQSGTGKELFAQAIHSTGERASKPFIPINCAAIPETLLEGMLFGTVKGSYTDAVDKAGLFEEAEGGTLVLDELNSMPMGLQAKLLRVLQEKKVRRLGSHKEVPIDVRIISVLNENPLRTIEQGVLRQDLYYRLAVVGMGIPALRERPGDIPLLCRKFIESTSQRGGRHAPSLDDDVMHMFMGYAWPGNIRELRHVIEGSLALFHGGNFIGVEDLPQHFLEGYYQQSKAPSPLASTQQNTVQQHFTPQASYYDYKHISKGERVPLKTCLRDYEESCLSNVLRYTGGNVAKAARIVHMTPSSLHYRLKVLGVDTDI